MRRISRVKLRRPVPSDALTFALLLVLIAGLISLWPSNYYMLLPGDARPVSAMIRIPGYSSVHSRGGLYMTDVTIYHVTHKLEEWYGRANQDADLEPVQAVTGNLSDKQYMQQNAVYMTDSIKQAEIAALVATHRLRLKCKWVFPQIQAILRDTPASRLLRPGDFIEAVDGRDVCGGQEVSPLLRTTHGGQVVRMQILRGRHVLHLRVRAISARVAPGGVGLQPSSTGHRGMLGIYMQDNLVPGSAHLPLKIHINPGNTVGPSAGLMFTLGIIQRLERRDLTRGCKVAGTGTIDFLGNVGEIGGAKQKILAARSAGAQYFIVPDVPDNLDPARAHRGSVTVLPVNRLSDALRALSRIKPCH